MFLNQELLQSCEEFFDQIANMKNSEELNDAVESLRTFLERDVDGYTHVSEEKLAYATQSRLEKIWKLISKVEKQTNTDLLYFYKEVIAITEDSSGYEADDIEADDSEEVEP